MQPEGELHRAAARWRRRIIWLNIPTLLTLAFELVGGWRYGKDPYSGRYAIHLGPFHPLIWLTLAAVVVCPLLIVGGFATAFSKWNTLRANKGWLSALLLLLMLSLLLCMFSCAWSCGGHPTWMDGYK